MLINEFSKLGKLEGALKIFGRMMEVGFKTKVGVYNKWFGVLCKEGKLDKAQKLVQAMVDGGQKANVATYDVLIEGFGNEGRSEEAKSLFLEFLQKGCLTEELEARLGGKPQEPNVAGEAKPTMEAAEAKVQAAV
jgi:pentatricopeptide repeat protein